MILLAACFCCLVVALQQTLVVPAIPHLPTIMGASSSLISWAVTLTLLTGAVTTPIFGRLSDLYGKRQMLWISMTCVFVGSIIAPLGGVTTLLVGRALQGVGTALVPVAMALLRDALPDQRVNASLAVLSATLGVGGSVGIPLGGVMLQAWGWESMFWLSAVLSLISLALIFSVLPMGSPQAHGNFDVVGALLLSCMLLSLLVGISQGGAWGWTNSATISIFIVSLLLAAAWVAFELRHNSPLVDLRTSGTAPLLSNNIASLVLGILMFTNLLLTTRRLQNPVSEAGAGWQAAGADLAMLPTAVAMFAVAGISAGVARRFGARSVLIIGACITAVGYAAGMSLSSGAALMITWTTVISIGVGMGYAALPMLIFQHAPPASMGEANGVNALLRAIGTSISSALVATIVANRATVVNDVSVPSSEALALIGAIGVVLSIATIGFGMFVRAPK